MSLEKVKHIVLVLSGKGGVGKSSITLQLALTLSSLGHSVGILDIDLTGPSIPHLLGLESHRVTQAPGGWLPVPVHPSSSESPPRGALTCMSLGFLLPTRSSAVIWRGPKKTAMIRQFLSEVLWGPLDFLLIDTPPGTSDEHISLAETLLSTCRPGQLAGAVVVTTPQAVATADVRKELNFCGKVGVEVLGVVENMSGFVCPCCGVGTNVFSKGGGEVMAGEFGVGFLGSVPIDPLFGELVEGGRRPVYGVVGGGGGEGSADGGSERQVYDGENGLVDEGVNRVIGRDGHANGAEARDDELLVEKYKSCSLYPIFKDISQSLVEKIESSAMNGGTTS